MKGVKVPQPIVDRFGLPTPEFSRLTASGSSGAGGTLTDGDKGDITVSSAGAAWAIDPDAVTFAKMQNIATAKLLGRGTAGTGNVEEITLGTNLSFTGTTLNAAGGGGATNLSYTAAPTNGTVASDTGTDATLTLADGTNAGLMAPAQHTKLAGIATGATVNSADATLLARANHTGSQAASTISDFDSASRAQTEAELVAGANITITPGSSGATRTLTIAASGGGSDPWTYVKLGSDFVTSSATAVPITGMAFTPAANTSYEVEVCLLLRTATATVGPRPGVGWPTGLTDGVVYMQTTSAAGTVVMQNGNANAAVLGPVGGLPNTTQSYPAQMQATIIAGASPSGTFKLNLATETAATNVTAKAGSWLKYRII